MTEVSVVGVPCTGLITQFGGGAVRGGKGNSSPYHSLPTQSLLVPSDTPTRWEYSGVVDYAVFYFEESENPTMRALERLARSRGAPLPFADALVGAAARQLLDELQKGPLAEEGFMERLASLMLEQTYRVLTTPTATALNPRHGHYRRLQAVLNQVQSNLNADLSVRRLAGLAGVSVAHFRRLFEEATGLAPHRYVLSARLEKARNLLTLSDFPLARIAQQCGFSSQSHLTSSFRTAHSVTPAKFRAALARRPQTTPRTAR